MKTFLQLVTAAMDELGFDAPATLIGNTDTAAKRMVRVANHVGDELAKNEPPSTDVISEYTFNLVNGTQTYAMPTDYLYMMPSSQWDRTRRRALIGSLRSMEWQSLKAWTTSFGLNYRFRIRNRLLEIQQTVSTTDQIAFEYVSQYWVMAYTNTAVRAQVEFLNDQDVCTFNDELVVAGIKAEFLDDLGFDTAPKFQARYEEQKAKYFSREWSPPVISLDQRKPSDYDPMRFVNVPDSNYGS